LRTTPSGAARPGATPRPPRGAGARRRAPTPVSPDIPLPPPALVVVSAGAAPATGFVLLLAIALLGAVALTGPAGPALRLAAATRRLRSRGGRRLERPG
ncbi:MAG: hypothetical protein M3P44_14135, partial [Actinomycetota bacterium]|nr:hypothetical protein [Actinomycetota bacterium]